MNHPRPLFGNRSPQDMADGKVCEQRAVLEALVAIDCGLFS